MSINSDCLREVGLENLHSADDVLFLTPEEESHHNQSCGGTENEHSNTNHKEVEENLNDDHDDEEEDEEAKLAEVASNKYSANQISIVAGNEFDLNDEDEEPAVKIYSNKNADDTQTHVSNCKDTTYSSPVSFGSLSASNALDLNASKLNDDANNSSSINNSHYDENNIIASNNSAQQDKFLNENQMLTGGENDSAFKSIIEEPILNDINKYLFKNTRYFLIKSNNYENVNLAKQKVI